MTEESSCDRSPSYFYPTRLSFLAIVVASEHVSIAFASGITGSLMINYDEAIILFILDSITL